VTEGTDSPEGVGAARLLASLRALDVRVDVSSRVMRSIAGLRPVPVGPPSARELVPAVAAALVMLALALGRTNRAVSPAIEGGLASALPPLVLALARIAAGSFELLAPLGRAAVAMLDLLPSGDGRLPMIATTGFSLVCLASLLVSTAVLVRRDLRREPSARRS
jgi:hypothetical protein